MNLRPETEKEIRNIMDTFSGADGGGNFLCFRLLVEEIDKQASNGDKKSMDILDVITRFSRLIDIAKKAI